MKTARQPSYVTPQGQRHFFDQPGNFGDQRRRCTVNLTTWPVTIDLKGTRINVNKKFRYQWVWRIKEKRSRWVL